METRAPFVLVGAFVLAAIVAVFGFVFWLHNTSGLGARSVYRVEFNGSVPGLLVGAAVLFNGIRVGEVTELSLSKEDARRVNASIAVAAATPVRADTKVGLDFQGLTGVPVIALEGGTLPATAAEVPTLVAEPGAGQSMTQAARDALRRVDTILVDNADAVKDTMNNLKVFSGWLAQNTGRLDAIVGGVERMTGGGEPAAPKTIYDLQAPGNFGPRIKPISGQLAVAEPTGVVMFDTQRILLAPGLDLPAFGNVQWSDSLPKMLQAKLLQGFENYDIAHPPLRASDATQADHQLMIDIRSFQVAPGANSELSAEIGFSAKLLDKNGHVVAAKLFRTSSKLDKPEPPAALAAFNAAFETISKELIAWTAASL
jgi:phospholipid/cholesterol/gamma-HCH transport system substrate-binding protein